PDGKLIVAGYFHQGGVFRLNVDGSLDATFNAEPAGLGLGVVGIQLQDDGKLVLRDSTYRLVRLNRDGSLDRTFNTSPPGGNLQSLALQRDGRLVFGQSTEVRRLNSNGSLDGSFVASNLEVAGTVEAAIQQPDGKLVILGSFSRVNGLPAEELA